MKKKGFTLIELLAVIIILGIIALVVGAVIGNIIEKVRKESFKQSVSGIIQAGENYIAKHLLETNGSLITYPVMFVCDGIECTNGTEKLEFQGPVPKSGTIIVQARKDIEAEYVSDGKYCVSGPKSNLQIGDTCADVDITNPTLRGVLEGRTLILSLNDNESGIDSYCVTTINDANECSWINTNTSNVEYDLPEAGTYYVYLQDKKGNISPHLEFTADISAFNYDATESTYAATQAITTYDASVVTETSSMSYSREGCGHCYINGHYEGYLYCEQQGVAVDTSCGCSSGWNEVSGHCERKSYSCNSGDTRSGTTCTHNAGYTCNAGDILDDQTCYHYECPEGGTLNGTICER